MTAVTDNFPGSSLSGNWTILLGTVSVSGGVVTCTSGPFVAIYTGATWGANQKASAKVSAIAGSGSISVYSRLNTGTFNGYDMVVKNASNDATTQRIDGGVTSDLHVATTVGIASGDVFTLDPGTTSAWQAIKNGSNLGSSVTDATYASGGAPGFGLGAVGDAISQWIGDDGVASGPTITPTGFALTTSQGTPTLTFVNNPTIAPTGFGLLASRGTPTVNTGSNVTATPSGTLLTMSLGTFTTETDTTLIGMSVGALTMSLGTATVSSASGATQTPTGTSLIASLGTPSVAIISNPTPLPVGFSLGATLGTPTLVSSGPTEMVSGFPLALLLGVPAILGTTSSVRQRAFCPRPGPFGFFS